MTETAETNTRDVVGWVDSALLPPLVSSYSVIEEEEDGGELPYTVSVGCATVALVLELCGELCGLELSQSPALTIFLKLTHQEMLETFIPIQPTVAASLLKLACILVSCACEGLTPGSPPTLPPSTHPLLLSGVHRALAFLSLRHPGLAAGAMAAMVDRVTKLESGGKATGWGVEAASSALASLLSAVLFPAPTASDDFVFQSGGRVVITAAASASTRVPWGTNTVSNVLCSALRDGGAPALCTEALGVCATAAKRQGLMGVLESIKGMVEEVQGLRDFLEKEVGGVDILASLSD